MEIVNSATDIARARELIWFDCGKMNINTWQDNRPSNLLIKEHNEHNLTQVDAINYFYFYLPGDRGGPGPDRDLQRPWQQAACDRSHRPGDVHQLRWASLSFVIFCLALDKSRCLAPRGKNIHEYLFYQHYWLIDRKMLHDVQRYGLPGDIFRRTNAPSQGREWQWNDIYLLMKLFCFVAKEPAGESLLTCIPDICHEPHEHVRVNFFRPA